MSNFTPTPEQIAIVNAVTSSQDNLIIDALAGAAKTSTLILIAEAVPKTPTLAIAFNKKIADELTKRMPPNVTSKTLHSLGYTALKNYLGARRMEVKDFKNSDLFNDLVVDLDLSEDDRGLVIESKSDYLKAVSFGAQCGWLPEGPARRNARPLMDDYEFRTHFENTEGGWALDDLDFHIIKTITERGIKLAIEKHHISFDDMVLLPTVYPARFEQFPLTMIDETQDLSKLNHAMLAKIVGPSGRLIAVGDPCQSIYGFRGAHQDSMQLLQSTFNMKPLGLSVTFRCASSIVDYVQWRAPHMRPRKNAPVGIVKVLNSWTEKDIPVNESVAIVCRNNAPLFRMALRLIKVGRRPQIIGNDILKGLIKDIEKLGPKTMTAAEAQEPLSELQKALERKFKKAQFISDKIEAIGFFLEAGGTIAGAIDAAKALQNAEGPVKLMTGHKSKGLEYGTVFWLDPQLLKMELQQEQNLNYVIATRAKEELYLVTSEGWYADAQMEAAE